MPEPQGEYPAAGPVHDERKQDDGQDYHDHPEEEHDDAGNGMPRYSSRSSHGRQLPTAARFIRRYGWRTIRPGIPPAAFALYAVTASASGYTAPTWGRRWPSSIRRASSAS